MNAITERSAEDNLLSGPLQREHEAIADRIAADAPARVLDWGAGLGLMSRRLAEAGMETVAFEYDPDVDGISARPLKLYPELEATVSDDSRRLPFEDHSFDAVLSCGVLEHVADPEASLEELRRVLKPGGGLYVYKLANRFSYLEFIARRFGMPHHGSWEHDRLYTTKTARDLIESSGYEVLECRFANMLPLTMGPKGRGAGALWAVSRFLSRIPGLNRLATNVEVVAKRA